MDSDAANPIHLCTSAALFEEQYRSQFPGYWASYLSIWTEFPDKVVIFLAKVITNELHVKNEDKGTTSKKNMTLATVT